MAHNRRVAPYEVEYFEGLSDDELPLDMKGPNFLVWLRREACAAQGLDLSHIPDHEMFGFPYEFLHFPNMTGPVAGNSYLNLRIRPNGMDPDSCVFEIRSLFLYGEGKAPTPETQPSPPEAPTPPETPETPAAPKPAETPMISVAMTAQIAIKTMSKSR